MADLFTRYSGSAANDSRLNGTVIANAGSDFSDDYTSDGVIQRRFGVTVAYAAGATKEILVRVVPKIGANYGANVNAAKVIPIGLVASSTVYQEFICNSDNTPKDYRLQVNNDSGDSATVTVEHQAAVLSDT